MVAFGRARDGGREVLGRIGGFLFLLSLDLSPAGRSDLVPDGEESHRERRELYGIGRAVEALRPAPGVDWITRGADAVTVEIAAQAEQAGMGEGKGLQGEDTGVVGVAVGEDESVIAAWPGSSPAVELQTAHAGARGTVRRAGGCPENDVWAQHHAFVEGNRHGQVGTEPEQAGPAREQTVKRGPQGGARRVIGGGSG